MGVSISINRYSDLSNLGITGKKSKLIEEIFNIVPSLNIQAKSYVTRYSIDELIMINQLVKDGYDSRIFFSYEQPITLLEMIGLGYNLSDFKWLKVYRAEYYDSKCNILYRCIQQQLDLFMFYAYGQADYRVISKLYEALKLGINLTREVDYGKYSIDKALSYITLRMQGASRFYTNEYCLNYGEVAVTLYSMYKKWTCGKEEFDKLCNFVSDNTTNGLNFYEECKRRGLDYLEYKDFCNAYYSTNFKLRDLTNWTVNFSPVIKEKLYRQYLEDYLHIDCSAYPMYRRITFGSKLPNECYVCPSCYTTDLDAELYDEDINQLIEMCYIGNQDINKYVKHLQYINTTAMICIGCGIDLSIYFNLGLNYTQLKVIYEEHIKIIDNVSEVLSKTAFNILV